MADIELENFHLNHVQTFDPGCFNAEEFEVEDMEGNAQENVFIRCEYDDGDVTIFITKESDPDDCEEHKYEYYVPGDIGEFECQYEWMCEDALSRYFGDRKDD